MFEIIGSALISLQAVSEVLDCICKRLTLPDSLGCTLVQTKIPDLLFPPIVRIKSAQNSCHLSLALLCRLDQICNTKYNQGILMIYY